MKIEINEAKDEFNWNRRYIIEAKLKNFRGHADVRAHIFRPGATEEEMKECLAKNLVGPPAPEMPQALLEGMTEKMALECLLETFTLPEAKELAKWLEKHYSGQIAQLDICPISLPVPLGVGPLAGIPESQTAGFINFDLAKNYDLGFLAKAYYDLNEKH